MKLEEKIRRDMMSASIKVREGRVVEWSKVVEILKVHLQGMR